MMGGAGLTKDLTGCSYFCKNYLAKALDPKFPVLYKGKNGLIAHECIIDLRDITKNTGVTVDDIAKA
jgi:glycine dehydrogenase